MNSVVFTPHCPGQQHDFPQEDFASNSLPCLSGLVSEDSEGSHLQTCHVVMFSGSISALASKFLPNQAISQNDSSNLRA